MHRRGSQGILYGGIHRLVSKLTLEVLAVGHHSTKLRLRGEIEDDPSDAFEVMGWVRSDLEPPIWPKEFDRIS